MDKETIARAWQYLSMHGQLHSDCAVAPHDPFKIPYFQNHVAFVKNLSGKATETPDDAITPLMMFFLQCGARFYGEPALDGKMRRADFFFALDHTSLRKSIDLGVL